MRPTPAAVLLLALGILLCSSAHAARPETRPDTVRLSRVTVYVDRAEVVREATLALSAGDTEVVVATR
jgi:hypothetical protein